MLVSGIHSKEIAITCGVPQASILGPVLFGIFIYDLSLRLPSKSVKCDLFADDGTLNTASDNIGYRRRNLQQNLIDVSYWCCTKLMALNQLKPNAC